MNFMDELTKNNMLNVATLPSFKNKKKLSFKLINHENIFIDSSP
jgi:hypothetical protein